jgi:hypothetical protein
MESFLKLYISIYRLEYNKLKKDYDKAIDITLKKKETHNKLTKSINDKYIKLQKQPDCLNYDEIKNRLSENKNESFDSVIMKLTNSDSKKIRNEQIKRISILQAYKRFTFYLNDLSLKYHNILPGHQNKFNKIQNEFTTSRQVLCAYYILISLDIELEFINKSDIAKLIHLISGNNIPLDENGKEKIDNSLVYKKVKNLFIKTDTKSVQDLNFILKYFENIETPDSIGIKKIIKMIRCDINGYKKV